jgi:hypothetical protein
LRKPAVLLLLLALAAAALAVRLFPRAFPIVAITDRIGRDVALQRADSFISANGLAPDSARRAIQFTSDDSLRTFIELAGGGKDTLDALLRGQDVVLYSWSVRAFVPGDAREVQVRLAPDGRIIGVSRLLPDSLVRPSIGDSLARRLADSVIVNWLAEPLTRWKPVTASYVIRTPSGRTDRTFTYERTDRRVATAPLRLDVVIAGDLPAQARPYVLIPESFARRYREMRSANGFLSLLATVGVLGCFVAAMVSLRGYARQHSVRWRPAIVVGVVGGVLVMLAMFNQLPLTWHEYDTAGPPELHQFAGIALALAAGSGTLLLLTLTLAAAEALTRQAFPWHIDWWKYWKYRGTREVAGRVGAGYAVAAFGFAWVAMFYLVTRGVLGWWVPSELMDDPNLAATRLPWVGAIGLSLQAAVSEEALFRAVPLSLIALWVGGRKERDRWMALGVIATALLFGFAHSDYASWPPYSRGVEIFLEACVWGVLFLRFGILVPVIAHFVYDLVLFGLFASAGSDVQYRVSAVVLLLALLAPALSVLWALWRQRGWIPLGNDAWFQGWQPKPTATLAAVESMELGSATAARINPRWRLVAPAIGTLALISVVASPAPRRAGPDFVVSATGVWSVADSMLRARGLDPARWRRLSSTARDTLGDLRRFLRAHGAESLAVARSGDYMIPAWWIIRYVQPDAALEERTEEWRVRVLPDGRPLDLRHVIPEAARRDSIPPDSVRRLAMMALDSVRIDTASLRELEFVETPRPVRRDASIAYGDTSIVLPDAATARVSVALAGDEVLSIKRGIQLPEPFVRQSRSDGQKALALSGLLGLPAVVLLLVGIVRSRRLPMVATDDLPRRSLLVMLLAFALTSVASSAQSVPSSLALYDTAVPWRTFLVSAAGTQAVSLVGVFVVAAFWVLANGMRRRAGIPLVAGPTAVGGVSDDLAAALVLGGVPVLTGFVGRLVQAHGVPVAPETTLDVVAPVLAHALDVVPNAMTMLLVVSIPALALTLLARRRVARLAGVTAFLGSVAAAFMVVRVTGEPNIGVLRQAVPLAIGALIVLAIVVVGRVSVLSWLLGALFLTALGSVSVALHAPTGIERVGGLLAVMLAASLIVAGDKLSRRSTAARTG